MKIAIISDLHGNLEALNALPQDYDELWVLGDLVNYGPNPSEVVDFIRQNAKVVVRGNHDHAIGYGVDPQCSAPFRAMAEATGAYTNSVLTAEQKKYLGRLPLYAERIVAGHRFFLCHAVPSATLYSYCGSDSPQWEREAASFPACTIFAGHTHLPFMLRFGDHQVVNPGSLGQPKHGAPRACYAVWQDGRIDLRSYEYPVEETVRKARAMPVPEGIRKSLAAVLRGGSWTLTTSPGRSPAAGSKA